MSHPFGRIARSCAFAALALAAVALLPQQATAIPRDTAIARGRVWAVAGVPYSQSGYADVNGTVVSSSTQGWRRDCSGFVSMALNLTRDDGSPLSLDTAGLPLKLQKIQKDLLQPGDVIMRPKNQPGAAYGHAVMFVRWTDDTRTKYVGLQESSGAGKAVETTITYPFYSEKGFEPYRYPGIEEEFADVQVRVSGADRFETAVSSSKLAYPATAPCVIVASGENWPDALGGSALAGATGGPLLLTGKSALPSSTRSEIARLKPGRVFVLGGEASVSKAVESQIASLTTTVVRLGGRDRYETAALVARRAVTEARAAGKSVDTAYVATGLNFPDALAVSPVAAKTCRPVLLTEPGAWSAASRTALRDLGITKVEVLGGEVSVTPAVVSALTASGVSVHRIADRDRYTTAVAVARHGVALGLSWSQCGIASGTGFADALAGGAAQGATGSVLLLTDGVKLPAAVSGEVAARAGQIGKARVFGGMKTITMPVRQSIADLLRLAQ